MFTLPLIRYDIWGIRVAWPGFDDPELCGPGSPGDKREQALDGEHEGGRP